MRRVVRRLQWLAQFNPMAAAGRWSGLNGTVTCLLYHRIAAHSDRPYLERGGVPVTPPDSFRRQLRELFRHGAQFLTFADLAAGERPATNRPGFVITFDDGFRDNFTVGCPILDEFGIRAVFFVATAMIERATLLWEHRLYRLADDPERRARLRSLVEKRLVIEASDSNVLWILRGLASARTCDELIAEVDNGELPAAESQAIYPRWEDLRRAADSGHQIGSHTVHHRMRHTLTAAEFLEELSASKAALEAGLQRETTAFSYPYNDYFFGDDELCRQAGYQQAATVDGGRLKAKPDWFWIPRLTIHRAHDNAVQFRRLILEGRN